ncbi:hypothetical protein ABZW18_01755 [Streptomyces sp. NPDC004647]|uniref:hypothetical protein n=1 Tax=Streptomyces sp. NPDC004647 TaxID=3154671 RepID=UPI0033B6FD33
MSWTLALEYLRVLIWPVIVLVLGVLFKKQVGALFDRLESVETPVGTVTLFDKQAGAIAQEADEVSQELAAEVVGQMPPPAATGPSWPTYGSPGPAQQQPATQGPGVPAPGGPRPPGPPGPQESPRYAESKSPAKDFAVLRRQADLDPTKAVLGAWRALSDALVQTMPEQRSGKPPQAGQALNTAGRDGLLNADLHRVANDLQMLRNRVVHEGDVALTPEGARSYVRAAETVIEALALARLQGGDGSAADTEAP